MADNDVSEIGFYQYEGYALEEKIGWVRQGEGSGALFEAQSALAQLGFDLVESERALRDQVKRLGSSWEGTAGTAAGAAMMMAAKWSAESAPAADQAWSQVGMQSESVDRTKNGMPGTAPAPEYGFGDAFGDAMNMQTGNLFDVQTNFDEQVAQRRAAEELANRLLYQHEAASRTNLAAMPPLGEVPTITVQTEEQSGNLHLLEKEQVTENLPPKNGDDDGSRNEKQTENTTDKQTEKPTEQTTEKPTEKPSENDERTENQIEGEQPRDGDLRSQEPQEPRESEQDGPRSLRPNDSVSAAGFVPETDRPQPQQPSHRGGIGGGIGSLGGGGFVGGGGGFGAADSSRAPVRGPGPQTGAAPGRGGPAGAAAARGGVPAGAGRGGGGLFGPPPAGARSGDEEDGEHSDKYFRGTDELFRTDDIPAMGHSVIGADEVEQP